MLLDVKNLKISFHTDKGVFNAVNGISFNIFAGKTLCLVGESGCGKSVTALSLLRLIDKPGKITDGTILLENKDLVLLSEKEMRNVRGKNISMIFQEPMTSLNPSYTIGSQIKEVLRLHKNLKGKDLKDTAINALALVAIPSPKEMMREYPFKLSGGMRQRVMIAIAMACSPKLLIADEPTTALDVTIQAQVLTLIKKLQSRENTAVLFITHDLGVVSEVADDVAVMYMGEIVENGDIQSIFSNPKHPYTQGLFYSLPPKGITKDKSKLFSISGNVPSIFDLPKGCAFWPRCQYAKSVCKENSPLLKDMGDGHYVSCFKAQGDF